MHPCLNVDEILRIIARELVASGGKATAVSLACCCKSFEDPALDALWARQELLLPLLKSLPGDVWDKEECTVSASATWVFSFLDDSTRKSFRRLPTTTEWVRFRKYARRMQELRQRGTRDSPSPEVFSVIQLWTINEPLFPNLKTLDLWGIKASFIPFVPMFLSPRTTTIELTFLSNLPKAMVASTITTLPRLCPNLQSILLGTLPRDPMITAAVSGMLLATDRNALREFDVNSPLTEEASEVLYKLPNLRMLFVVIDEETSLPPALLPSLTELRITCDNEDDWLRLFRGATLGKLESVTFYPRSEQIGDFLEAFEKAALSLSIQNTLSEFYLSTSHSWNPNYSSLLPFTQMVDLDIEFSCDGGCSSTVDDDIVTSLSRVMPKLKHLKLGDDPCPQPTAGVTAKGFVALAHHCPNLSTLRVHFQVASLSVPPASPDMTPDAEPAASWVDCALTDLIVGEIPVPEESVLIVALTLARIFPHIEYIDHVDENWEKVMCAICLSRRITDHSGKEQPSPHLEVTLVTLPQESQLRIVGW